MTANNVIADVLSAPLEPGWTVEQLAERVLDAVAAQPPGSEHAFAVDEKTDRQPRRLLRPLLACLALKSAGEAGGDADLYGGRLAFERPGPAGPVWVIGRFENRPGSVRVAMWCAAAPPAPESAHAGRAGRFEPGAEPVGVPDPARP